MLLCWLHLLGVGSKLGRLTVPPSRDGFGHSHGYIVLPVFYMVALGSPFIPPTFFPGFCPSPEGPTLMSLMCKNRFCIGLCFSLCLSDPSQSLGLERHRRLYEPHPSSQTYLPIPTPFAHMYPPKQRNSAVSSAVKCSHLNRSTLSQFSKLLM